jgi:hypothetical protein
LRTICLDWLQTVMLLISVSWVARIIGMNHWHPALEEALLMGNRFGHLSHGCPAVTAQGKEKGKDRPQLFPLLFPVSHHCLLEDWLFLAGLGQGCCVSSVSHLPSGIIGHSGIFSSLQW